MDLLKRELERKKRALHDAITAHTDVVVSVGRGNDNSSRGGSKRPRYLKAQALRQCLDDDRTILQSTVATAKSKESSGYSLKSESTDADDQQGTAVDESHKKAGIGKDEPPHDGVGTFQNAYIKTKTKDQRDRPVPVPTITEELQRLSPSHVDAQLRALGLPIRLFGERTVLATARAGNNRSHHDNSSIGSTNKNDNNNLPLHEDTMRLTRLAQALAARQQTLLSSAEMDEYRLGQGYGIRNTFLDRKGKDHTATAMKTDPTTQMKAKTGTTTGTTTTPVSVTAVPVSAKFESNTDRDEVDDPNDLHKKIYKYFKGLLRQWEEDLEQRPDEVQRSVAGRNEAKTVKQCKDYIRPLFKLCKNRKLAEELVTSIAKIVDDCKRGEFVSAHDTYMDIAIGRAAWPIGVTMVGIHARTGRAKIESKNVAHVMNSELQRKYLTSVKRLITYAQKKRDDVDPSKKVLC